MDSARHDGRLGKGSVSSNENSAGDQCPQKIRFEICQVPPVRTTRSPFQTPGPNHSGPELDEPTFAM